MKLLVAALLASVLPAFGQDVASQLAGQLHEACVAHAPETLQRNWQVAPKAPVDTARFCACADDGIRKDPVLEEVARLPESRRQPSSRAAVGLHSNYFLDGLDCYSKLAGWADLPAGEKGSRSLEEVRKTIEGRKGSLYRAYNRALESDRTLAGKVVFEFTIEQDGRVSQAKVVSSDLKDEKFVAELKSQLQAMRFAAEPVEKLVTTYPLEFLPN